MTGKISLPAPAPNPAGQSSGQLHPKSRNRQNRNIPRAYGDLAQPATNPPVLSEVLSARAGGPASNLRRDHGPGRMANTLIYSEADGNRRQQLGNPAMTALRKSVSIPLAFRALMTVRRDCSITATISSTRGGNHAYAERITSCEIQQRKERSCAKIKRGADLAVCAKMQRR